VEHNFVELSPMRKGTARVSMIDKIKVAFIKRGDGHLLRIQLGLKVLHQLGINPAGYVKFFVDAGNPLIYLIKPGKEYSDRKLTQQPKTKNAQSTLQISWQQRPIPEQLRDGPRFVSYDLWDGGVRLFLPGLDRATIESLKHS
jgi:hypothetical protein